MENVKKWTAHTNVFVMMDSDLPLINRRVSIETSVERPRVSVSMVGVRILMVAIDVSVTGALFCHQMAPFVLTNWNVSRLVCVLMVCALTPWAATNVCATKATYCQLEEKSVLILMSVHQTHVLEDNV
jgi:hypothetical protein